MQEIYDAYQAKGLVVLAINENDRETVEKYFDKQRYTFTPLLQKEREIHRLYQIGANPSNYIVGPHGKIVFGSEGYPEDQIRKTLERILRRRGL